MLESSLEHSQRSLKLVGGVAYELLLLFEHFFEAQDGLLRSIAELAEFVDVGTVRDRVGLFPGLVAVEPVQQGVERLHALPEHPERGAH